LIPLLKINLFSFTNLSKLMLGSLPRELILHILEFCEPVDYVHFLCATRLVHPADETQRQRKRQKFDDDHAIPCPACGRNLRGDQAWTLPEITNVFRKVFDYVQTFNFICYDCGKEMCRCQETRHQARFPRCQQCVIIAKETKCDRAGFEPVSM